MDRGKFYPDENVFWYERAKGDFDEEIDEMTGEQVQAYFATWSEQGWPGRRGNSPK